VRCKDKTVDTTVDILDMNATLNIDEQQTAWRAEGWHGHDGT
jgi:hypothetical protein